MNVDNKSAFILSDASNSELEFSTLPESWLMFLALPVFAAYANRLKKKKKKIRMF